MKNFEKYASLSYTHSRTHHCCYNGSSQFIRVHENGDLGRGLSTWGTFGSSEGGHYGEMAHVNFSLDEPKMKVVRNNTQHRYVGCLHCRN